MLSQVSEVAIQNRRFWRVARWVTHGLGILPGAMRIGGLARQRVVSNEQAEFADFFQASWEPCLRAVLAVVGSPQLAEDQVAEAFAKAWTSWRKVRRHPAPKAWVVRTALNTGASWWRRRSREMPLADHDLTAPGDLGDGLDACLLTALRRLPPRQREVIALRIVLDMPAPSAPVAEPSGRCPDDLDMACLPRTAAEESRRLHKCSEQGDMHMAIRES